MLAKYGDLDFEYSAGSSTCPSNSGLRERAGCPEPLLSQRWKKPSWGCSISLPRLYSARFFWKYQLALLTLLPQAQRTLIFSITPHTHRNTRVKNQGAGFQILAIKGCDVIFWCVCVCVYTGTFTYVCMHMHII